MDAALQPKPVYITPNEIYGMHSLLTQHLDHIAPDQNDALRVILRDIGGVPHLGSEELREARDSAITLELTNRFAAVRGSL
jgi:Ras GTPase-activating-like protein IQGAP2/3